MTKSILSLVAVFALAFTVSSCQQGTDDVKAAARETIQTTAPVAPVAPTVAVPTGPVTTVAFAANGTHDFGTVTEGEIVSHTF
jgi:PBP1b-binding outer membrane lipoprotein LpoB